MLFLYINGDVLLMFILLEHVYLGKSKDFLYVIGTVEKEEYCTSVLQEVSVVTWEKQKYVPGSISSCYSNKGFMA